MGVAQTSNGRGPIQRGWAWLRRKMEAEEVESAIEYTLEGIGSEVWLAFGVLSSAVIGIVLLLMIWRSYDSNDIHPQQVLVQQ